MIGEEIIELALQCGIWIPLASGPEREQTIDNLRRFAALVAAAERDALRAALQHEADCVEVCKSEIERLRAENVGLVDDMNLLRDNNASLRARIEEMEKQEPVKYEFQGRDGKWYPFIDQRHYENTVADGTWPIRSLYAGSGAKGEGK